MMSKTSHYISSFNLDNNEFGDVDLACKLNYADLCKVYSTIFQSVCVFSQLCFFFFMLNISWKYELHKFQALMSSFFCVNFLSTWSVHCICKKQTLLVVWLSVSTKGRTATVILWITSLHCMLDLWTRATALDNAKKKTSAKSKFAVIYGLTDGSTSSALYKKRWIQAWFELGCASTYYTFFLVWNFNLILNIIKTLNTIFSK